MYEEFVVLLNNDRTTLSIVTIDLNKFIKTKKKPSKSGVNITNIKTQLPTSRNI